MSHRFVLRLLPFLLLVPACGGEAEVPAGETPNCTSAPPIRLPDAADEDDVAEWLRAIPGVVSVQEEPLGGGSWRFFSLEFDQPADHCKPEGAHFTQTATFLFHDFDAPTVLATTGYGIVRSPYLTEPAWLLDANQLLLEHRYFKSSKPALVDWSTLNIEQAAWDQHRVTVAMRHFLTGPWLSTGASKGGMTAVYHRYFFPDDVEATLAYVAPLSFGRSDARYVDYLEGIGEPECRAALKALQRRALELREPLTARMVDEARAREDGYELLGPETAFSYAVVELPFSFWQYGGHSGCSRVPTPDTDAAEVYDFIEWVFDDLVDWYGDSGTTYYEGYWYQSATQLGGPAFPQDHLLDLLEGRPVDYDPDLYPPLDVEKPWDPDVMRAVDDWVRAEGDRLMFVYGEWDPWTAGAFTVGTGREARVYVVPEGNHGAALEDLTWDEQTEAEGLLRRWMGLESTSGTVRSALRADLPRETLLPRWPKSRL